jgi:hypothetical protein
MLRAISFLGGELPHVKTLKDMPFADYEEYSEGDLDYGDLVYNGPPLTIRLIGVTNHQDTFESFCEVVRYSEATTMPMPGTMPKATKHWYAESGETGQPPPLSKEEVAAKLSEEGMDKDVLASMPEKALAECAKMSARHYAEINESPEDKMDPDEENFLKRKDPQAQANLSEKYKRYSALAERYRKYDGSDELRGKNQAGQIKAIMAKDPHGDYAPSKHEYADDPTFNPPTGTGGLITPSPNKVEERRNEMQFSEDRVQAIVDAATRKVLAQLGPVKAEVAEFKESLLNEKKATEAETAARNAWKRGQITSAQFDSILARLLRADNHAVVETFSEGGKKVACTEFELQKRELARMPIVVNYQERIGAGSDASASGMATAKAPSAVEDVAVFWEQHSAEFAKCGFTKDEFVNVYKDRPQDAREMLAQAGAL